MNPYSSLAIILVVAVCTLLTRALPFMIFGGKRQVPKVVKYLGMVLPPAIMAILVVYCMKSVDFLSGTHGLPEIIASLVVVVLHLWRKNTLLSIGAGTICYMIMVQGIFV